MYSVSPKLKVELAYIISCLTVHVQGKDLTSGTTLRGCMHLVDLAGSERCDKTDAVGDRLKEAQHINRSLSALGDVIAALAQKNGHVPYRNSKLTQLLQDSLGGQAKTLMFVHISPEQDALGETLSTLKFAERVSTVELGAAKSNKDTSSPEVKELKEQIAMLKAALARNVEADLHMGSPASSVSSKTEDQSNFCSRRLSLDSQDSWPTIQQAVSSPSRRQSLATPVTTRHNHFNAEQDYIQKSSTVASNPTRPTAKPVKTQETRSQIPQPSGRVRGHSPQNKTARPTSTLVRRKTGGGK